MKLRAINTRTVKKKGRTWDYFSVLNGRLFQGMMVRVTTEREEGEPLVHWYVESEMENPEKEPCADVHDCFVRTVKTWKRRSKLRG